jgi:hypothetical protein
MSTGDAIRHLLRQTSVEAQRHLDAGALQGEDLEAVQSFKADAQELLARMEHKPVRGIDSPSLSKELFKLHRRCTGPLERFRGLLQDAISSAETLK